MLNDENTNPPPTKQSRRITLEEVQEEWELATDEEEATSLVPIKSSPNATSRLHRRGKRLQKHASYTSQSPSKRSSKPRPIPTNTTSRKQSLDARQFHLLRALTAACHFSLDVLVDAVQLLKFPITLLVAFYIMCLLLSQVYLAVTTPLTALLSSVCQIPGASLVGISFCQDPTVLKRKHRTIVDYPALMKVEEQSFGQLLDNAVASTDLVIDLKNAEMVSADLNTILMASDLPKKDYLSSAIVAFVQESQKAARAIQRLDAKIEGSIDQVVGFNQHTLQSIAAKTAESVPSILERVTRSVLLLPPSPMANLADDFDRVMSMLEIHMVRLMEEASQALSVLDSLEERLHNIHSITTIEGGKISSEKQDLLAELWTILGGNRRRLKKYEGHLHLLSNVDQARRRAHAHVMVAITTLEGMSSSLEDIRERASAPGLLGLDIPVEAHVLSMQGALERIREWRARAKSGRGAAVDRLITDS